MSIIKDLNFHFVPLVEPGFKAAEVSYVTDQDQTVKTLRTSKNLNHCFWQMKSVADDPGHQTVFCQLFPEVIPQARDHGVTCISKVRGQACPRLHRCPDSVWRSGRVTNRCRHPHRCDFLYKLESSLPFRGEGDGGERSFRCLLPLLEFVQIGRMDIRSIMGTPGTIRRRNEW